MNRNRRRKARPAEKPSPNSTPGLPLSESWSDEHGPACSRAEMECSTEFDNEDLAFASLLVAKLAIERTRAGYDIVPELLRHVDGFSELADGPQTFRTLMIAARLATAPFDWRRRSGTGVRS